ncbi:MULTISPECIES: FecCD family ABC transporter permease [Paenibacillus]|uniref:Iron ABC transporter permease n=3 Tax=Paenibacillus TaxID=44249 RepID=A0AAJ3J290_PAEPO|nr:MULTISPECIES: iron ABC transporter permease [Paenibacillus]AHC19928.1 sugar ABC transporter substrate-binding protein [Paenibacillus polymyxa CR1]ALA42176.1 sugar ABC transporter substrate-binding protein [Paenibacillus peoriae]APB76099.1 iron ABC transporter permease [Paenibacillus polymyxa]KOS00489.1 sugar ABC transporter substrate-binding protein [Paenibacillus polymyxa]MBP1176198.1 ABC-type Fe3+-siderophore transport system permease subunit [Paenibacillus sp. PvR133]
MKLSRNTRGISIILLLVVLTLLVAVLSMNVGKMNLSPLEVFKVIIGEGTSKQNLIVFDFRLPRIVLSILVGIGMGISGCIMQSLLKNDMASPGTLGISSGSGLFVLMYITLFASEGLLSPILLPGLAFAGGLTAAFLIFMFAFRRGRDISPTGLILTGVAMGSGYSALSLMLTLRLDKQQYDFALRWQAGDLWGDDWSYIMVLLPWVLIICFYVFYRSNTLNTLNLGNQTASGLGVAIKREFIGLTIAAVALASGSVALGGNFFFVGMVSPHLARKLVGPNHKLLLPTTALVGALVILIADTLTRTISFGADIPTGIIITILVTPYFLYLLSKAS